MDVLETNTSVCTTKLHTPNPKNAELIPVIDAKITEIISILAKILKAIFFSKIKLAYKPTKSCTKYHD